MDNYYIKDGKTWYGPMSEDEFEAHKTDKDQIIYWKPEFCVNRVLHPQFCDHAKTWVKPTVVEEKPVEVEKLVEVEEPEQVSEELLKKQVILHAEPLETKAEKTEVPGNQKKTEDIPDKPDQSNTEDQTKPQKVNEPTERGNGFTYKLAIIIIGFVLVFGAGFYVNSKLSVMFYQDIIIQESVKNIEYYTRDMMTETKEVKTEIDSLNAAMTREIKMLKKQIKEMKSELIELKYR